MAGGEWRVAGVGCRVAGGGWLVKNTVEPRYNDPQYNDIPDITINMLCPGKSYSKMYGTEPRYNDLRYNDIPDITMSF